MEAGAILLCAAILAACGRSDESAGTPPAAESTETAPESSEPAAASASTVESLADTDWRLVEFQSMDDAIGTVRPNDPSAFTMRLNRDGTVSMQLDCNRATGTWSAEASKDGQSGRFAFGPLAATRALCPPPNLDERIAADAEYVRSYLLKDGRLYLSLMADAGIYAWEPNTDEKEARVPFETEPDPAIEAAVLEAEPDYTRAIVDIDGRQGRYLYGRFDLNGDGKAEVLVYLLGSIFCGTGGCDLLLLRETEDGYSVVNNFPISRPPIIASTDETAGWKDLIRRESGGGVEPSYVRHVFDGEKYVEQERLPADSAPEGTWLLEGDYSYDIGIPLEPRS